jgi:hypothetical protein
MKAPPLRDMERPPQRENWRNLRNPLSGGYFPRAKQQSVTGRGRPKQDRSMMTANGKAKSGQRAATMLGAGAFFLLAWAAPAFAQSSCDTDIAAMQTKRQGQIADLNKSAKAKDGKLDPIAACPRLRALASTEQSMLAYMQKNQNWCNIPEAVLENVKEGSSKTASIANQACGLAAKVKKMQEQQAAGGGAGPFNTPAAPKLPAGPL